MVCHPTNSGGQSSRVTLAVTKTPDRTQLITIGVAGMPLNRDEVTAV
jgi:hypothetical protein